MFCGCLGSYRPFLGAVGVAGAWIESQTDVELWGGVMLRGVMLLAVGVRPLGVTERSTKTVLERESGRVMVYVVPLVDFG